MGSITITDSTEDGRFLAFDLKDILYLLGQVALESQWEISRVESFGAAASTFDKLSNGKRRIPGQTLLELAEDVTQIIDGRFAGYRPGEKEPWIIIWAVDSTAYDVQSNDETVLAQIRKRFKQVTDIPS